MGLIGAWLLDNLWPLIPAVDFQTLKSGLKPLIMHLPNAPSKIALTAISWMLIYHLWEFVQKKPPSLIWQSKAVTIMCGLEILMESNALQWEEVLGAILSLIAWNMGIKNLSRRKEVLVGLLITMLAWKGLSPFILRDVPVSFHWMPFGISIMGEPLYQISVMIQKCFLYGCLAWLLVERNTHIHSSFVLSVGPLLCLEIAQRYLGDHTPEITDPLLTFFLVLLIKNAFQRQQASQNRVSARLSHTTMSPHSTQPQSLAD